MSEHIFFLIIAVAYLLIGLCVSSQAAAEREMARKERVFWTIFWPLWIVGNI